MTNNLTGSRFRLCPLLLFVLSLCISTASRAQQTSRLRPAVILVVASRLMPDDLRKFAPPALQSLIQQGCTAVVSNRGASFQGPIGGYGSIGAGAGVGIPDRPLPAQSGDWRAFAAEMQSTTLAAHTGGSVGALGQAVRDAGGITALVGNAQNGADGTASRLIVMDSTGGVSVDLSGRGSVRPQKAGSRPEELAAAVQSLLARPGRGPSLILGDPGDTEDADAATWTVGYSADPAARGPLMHDALSRLSDLLLRLHPLVEQRRCLLVLVSPMPRARSRDGAPEAGLTPLVIWGLPDSPGPLTSASTRRPGLVLGLDLAPTILDFLVISHPRSMTGNSMLRAGWDLSPSAVWAMDERARDDFLYERAALILYMLLTVLIAFVPAVLKRPQLSGVRAWALRFAILAACSGPAALILPLATPAPGAWGPGLLAAALYVLLPMIVLRLRRPLASLAAACAMSALVLIVDGLTRGQLFRDALWGRMPIAAGRLYGIDNTCLGVFLGGGWVALGWLADFRGRLGRALACSIGLAIAMIISLPPLGANVGGGITSAVAVGFLTVFLSSNRPPEWSLRSVSLGILISVGLALGLLALGLALDTGNGPVPRSHLAAGMDAVTGGGLPVAWDIALRKLWQNLSISAWVVLPAAVVLYPVIRTLRRDRDPIARRLAAHPGMDAALHSLLPAMVAGFLFKDSGVVTDLFLILYYLGVLIYVWLDTNANLEHESGVQSPEQRVC